METLYLQGVGRDRREILLMEKKEEEARFAKERKAKVAKTDKKTTELLTTDLLITELSKNPDVTTLFLTIEL